MLPCCDMGRTDSFRIQEPFDEIESRGSSAIGAWERRRVAAFGGVTWASEERRPVFGGLVEFDGDGWLEEELKSSFKAPWALAEFRVPGRADAEGAGSPSAGVFLRLESNWGGSCPGASWPKTRPVAAAATAEPLPTSCRRLAMHCEVECLYTIEVEVS